MDPALVLLFMGGHLVILVGFVGLVYRLGRFVAAPKERWSWAILAALLVPWVLFLAFFGPLPLEVVLAMNVLVVGVWVWAWRTGRFSVERVPGEVREEVRHRREWMRTHRKLLVGLFIAYMLINLLWAFAMLLIALE